jgi:type II secretory pathway pseudopilin PulG
MKSRRVKQEHGFTMMQMVITIAIIAIVSTFGVLGIRTARAEFRKQSSARLFASYIEKARADSVRRHAAPGTESSVETFGAGTNTYAVTMDFGSGTIETRTFQLEPEVDFLTDAQKVTFDWRGRLLVPCPVTKSCVYQVRSTVLLTAVPVDVSGSGDITVDSQHFPDGSITGDEIAEVGSGDVNPDPGGTPAIEGTPTPDPVDGGGGGTDPVDPLDPTPTPTATPTATPPPTPNGNGNGNGGDNGNNGNGNATPTPTPVATPTSTPIPQCSASISPSTLTLSQSDAANQTGTATFTMSGGTGVRIISAAQDGNGNSLVLGLSLVRIDGSGSSTISVTTKHGAGNRGVFSVKISADPSCGTTQTLTVIVNN